MPNVKYSGSKGIVQSTGTGQFHISGVGIAQDVETLALTGNAAASAYGVTNIPSSDGVHTVTVANPTTVDGAAGQTKLIVATGALAGEAKIASAGTADLIGDNLNAAGNYCLLMWTGSDWVTVAELTT